VRRNGRALSFVFLAFALLGCGRFPSDFDSLPLEQQVHAYSNHLNATGGIPSLHAESEISWHGWSAADLMAKCLDGRSSDLPPREALEIIALVQRRGCWLKGTAADRAVSRFLLRAPKGSLELQVARFAADVIAEDNVDKYIEKSASGPCSEALKQRQQR
jgi:hypothetical protein